jgi:hypothetical protein
VGWYCHITDEGMPEPVVQRGREPTDVNVQGLVLGLTEAEVWVLVHSWIDGSAMHVRPFPRPSQWKGWRFYPDAELWNAAAEQYNEQVYRRERASDRTTSTFRGRRRETANEADVT